MPVIEIVTWAISEAYAADPSVLKPALDFLAKVDGSLAVYSGVAEEDKKTFHLLIVWETFDHHKALMDHPEYPQIIGLAPSVGKDGLKMNHVEFIKEFTPALTAPATEVLSITLKEGVTKEHLVKVVDAIIPHIEAANPKHAPVTWGQTLEEADKFFLTIGWDSSQAHRDIMGQPSFLPYLTDLRNAAVLKMFHVGLVKHA